MMTTYAKLTRKQVLGLLAVATVSHDVLICHRDGSFTIRCGYHKSPVSAEANIVKLKKNTRAIVIKKRHICHGRDVAIEIRFAFEERNL
jgi:hypothetical protein